MDLSPAQPRAAVSWMLPAPDSSSQNAEAAVSAGKTAARRKAVRYVACAASQPPPKPVTTSAA